MNTTQKVELGFADLDYKLPITRRVGVGRPPTTARNYPEKIDFFEMTKDYRGSNFTRDEEAHKAMHAAGFCGDPAQPYNPASGPRRLPIRLLSDDLRDSLSIKWQCWGGSKLLCEGNGAREGGLAHRHATGVSVPCRPGMEWAEWGPEGLMVAKKKTLEALKAEGVIQDVKAGSRVPFLLRQMQVDDPESPPPKRCFFAENKDCKVTTQLVFQIDGLPGFCRFRSHGINTAKEIRTSFMMLMKETQGVLYNIPLALVVKWKPVTHEGKTSSAPIVHVEERNSREELRAIAAGEMAVRQRLTTQMAEDRKLLAAAVSSVDGELVDAEFGHPEADAVVEQQVQAEQKPSGNLGGGK